MSLKHTLKSTYTGGIPNIHRQVVPQPWSNYREGSIPSTFLCYGHDKINGARGSCFHGTTRMFLNKAIINVLRRETYDGFVHISQCFKSNSLVDWQPMQLFEQWLSMVTSRFKTNQLGTLIL